MYNFENWETTQRTNQNSVKHGTETIASLGGKIRKILSNDYKELKDLYQCLNPKLKNGKQMNVLADYAKHISSKLVLLY